MSAAEFVGGPLCGDVRALPKPLETIVAADQVAGHTLVIQVAYDLVRDAKGEPVKTAAGHYKYQMRRMP